jgi:hypothetical protein
MDLFITPGFTGSVISTQCFLESRLITPADAMVKLLQTYDTEVSYMEHDLIWNFIRSACGCQV